MSFLCYVCNSKESTNEALIEHFRVSHGSLRLYKCSESFCDRMYTCFQSFKRHRKLNHSETTSNIETVLSLPNIAVMPDLFGVEEGDNYVNSNEKHECDVQLPNEQTSLGEIDVPFCANATIDSEPCHETKETCDSVCTANNGRVSKTSASSLELDSRVFENNFEKDVEQFLTEMYNFSDVNMKRVQDIVEKITTCYQSQSVSNFQKTLLQRLEELGESKDNLAEFKGMMNRLSNPFQNYNTQWKRLKKFEHNGTYVPPQKVVKVFNSHLHEDGKTVTSDPANISFVSLRTVLKKFLELPKVLDSIVDNMKYLDQNSDILENIVQGELWKKKVGSFSENDLILPILVYYDDYETNNVLGTHRGISKIGGVYANIPCLPLFMQSKTDNVFIFTLFHALDSKMVSFDILSANAIDELKFLYSDGITVLNGPDNVKIRFILITTIGDNLGVHEMHGFVTFFRAEMCCRFCLIKKGELQTIFNSNDCERRTKDNYEEHVKEKNARKTGITDRSPFNDVPGFHAVESLTGDVMHDVLEGVCRYDLGKILHFFIRVRKFFSLECLNQRISTFSYGPNEKQNKPVEITDAHITSAQVTISAAEMLCLVRNLNLIIGDLIERNDEHWNIVILLKKIVEICTSHAIPKRTIPYLKNLIEEYLQNLSRLFPGAIKFKHHLIIHYPELIENFGPLWNISCMTWERKHRDGKRSANSSSNRMNVCHTVAIRSQLKLNHKFTSSTECLDSSFEKGRVLLMKELNVIENYAFFRHSLPSEHNFIGTTEYVRYMGHEIRENTILMIASENEPDFYLVHTILLDSKSEAIIVASSAINCNFDCHFQAYEVVLPKKNWNCFSHVDLRRCDISRIVPASRGKYYVPKRWI